jgi:rhodanese-related sulfurtransferase
MQQILEYLVRHPFLTGATALVALAAIAYEASRARGGGQAVGPAEAVRLLNQGAVMLDVRTKEQYESGHVIDARNVPQAELDGAGESLKRFRDKAVITCCDTGMTGSSAARSLRASGFTKVANLRGGLQAWRAENLPLVRGDVKGK